MLQLKSPPDELLELDELELLLEDELLELEELELEELELDEELELELLELEELELLDELLLPLSQTSPVTGGTGAGPFTVPLLPCTPNSTNWPGCILLFQLKGVAV